jgi:hypothetical protein
MLTIIVNLDLNIFGAVKISIEITNRSGLSHSYEIKEAFLL